MPRIKIALTSRDKTILHITNGGPSMDAGLTRRMIFEAVGAADQEFKVIGKGDFRHYKGEVIIDEGEKTDAFASITHYETENDETQNTGRTSRFRINVVVSGTYFDNILEASLKNESIGLLFKTDQWNLDRSERATKDWEFPLRHGDDPDGNNVEWDVDKQDKIWAESVTFCFQPVSSQLQPP